MAVPGFVGPGFVEVDPAGDCDCEGCVTQRRASLRALPLRDGGHPAAHGARRALVLVATAGTVLGGGAQGAFADGRADAANAASSALDADGRAAGPEQTPQGAPGALYGGDRLTGSITPAASITRVASATPAAYATRTVTRAQILDRARRWVDAQVPYSMSRYWSDGYRQDCSGFVSMAWNLGSNQWTGSLAQFGVRISKSELQPGDMLLFHNPANPGVGSHVTLFGGWSDSARTRYISYEQTRPHTVKRSTPYAYWNHSSKYVAYRYRGLTEGGGTGGTGTGSSAAFPGAGRFGPGANNAHVTELGRMLVQRGGASFYTSGPGPRWSEADRRATQAFQRAQGWSGAEADGIPGPATWSYLVGGKGKNIGGSGSGSGSSSGSGGSGAGSGTTVSPGFPGAKFFRPGQSNGHVTELGKRLVKKGYGKHYTSGPGPTWSEADRRNVEAFQRAQGWRGADADGYPGPETWRRLFR